MTTGEFENVALSEVEHIKLLTRFGAPMTADYIEKLSAYLKMRPRKRYASHYAVILQWIRKDGTITANTPKPQPILEEAELNHRAEVLQRLPENRHRSLEECRAAIQRLDGEKHQ